MSYGNDSLARVTEEDLLDTPETRVKSSSVNLTSHAHADLAQAVLQLGTYLRKVKPESEALKLQNAALLPFSSFSSELNSHVIDMGRYLEQAKQDDEVLFAQCAQARRGFTDTLQ